MAHLPGYVALWTTRKDARLVTLTEYLAMPDDKAQADHVRLFLGLGDMLPWARANWSMAPKAGADEKRVEAMARSCTRHDRAPDPEAVVDLTEEEVWLCLT